jgi:predicted nucleotidyltransferase component of viral defense system
MLLMLSPEVFERAWIDQQRRVLGNCDPGILEKTVYALTLLGHLVDSRMPFLFKGGTSLLLHLDPVRRLSRDIDIVCGLPPEEVDAVLEEVATKEPFLRYEEDVRGHRGMPCRRHFRFIYRSALGKQAETDVLLDVVEEEREVHTIVDKRIGTSFLIAQREVLARVPTVESLLGDKLTAFAPRTSGVPLYHPDGTVRDVQQVAKQLFDVGVLFDAANDFDAIESSYDAVVEIERTYRDPNPSREDCLRDTWRACIGLLAQRPDIAAAYPDGVHINNGLQRMMGHVTSPAYVSSFEAKRTLVAKCALLVAHLLVQERFDFMNGRWTSSAAQLSEVSDTSFNGTAFTWLNGMKAVNPEAHFYMHKAISMLQEARVI